MKGLYTYVKKNKKKIMLRDFGNSTMHNATTAPADTQYSTSAIQRE